MDNKNNIFYTYSENFTRGTLPLGEDFEDKVFSRIKKVKRTRRNIAIALVGICLVSLAFIGQNLIFEKKPALIQAHREALEEVPVIENVEFASFDTQDQYTIENVSYTTDGDTI